MTQQRVIIVTIVSLKINAIRNVYARRYIVTYFIQSSTPIVFFANLLCGTLFCRSALLSAFIDEPVQDGLCGLPLLKIWAESVNRPVPLSLIVLEAAAQVDIVILLIPHKWDQEAVLRIPTAIVGQNWVRHTVISDEPGALRLWKILLFITYGHEDVSIIIQKKSTVCSMEIFAMAYLHEPWGGLTWVCIQNENIALLACVI